MPCVDRKMISFTLTDKDVELVKTIADCECMQMEDLLGIAEKSSVVKLSALGFIQCDSEKCCISDMIKKSLAETLRKKRAK